MTVSSQFTVSVIVPTYNRADYLASAVRSLLSQDVPPHEIIVVNDGSNFDVRAYLDKHDCQNVVVIDIENSGKPHAVNVGVSRCTGSHIWVFDDDDVADPTFVRRALDTLESHRPDYVYGWHYAARTSERFPFGERSERRPELNVSNFFQLLWGCSFAHNAIIASKACYDDLGGFDESYPCSEDYEFQLRLARSCAGVYIDTPAFTRRLHSGERGAVNFRYAARDRARKFLAQDQRFIQRWLSDVGADEFPVLEQLCVDDESDAKKRRARRVFKAGCAARVGLWSVAIECLSVALQEHPYGRLTSAESAFIKSILVYQNYWVYEELLTSCGDLRATFSAARPDAWNSVKKLIRAAAAKRAYVFLKQRSAPELKQSLGTLRMVR